jgi:hypothetical protein
VEKNVQALVEIEQGLREAGMRDCRFLIVGKARAKIFFVST